MAALITVNDLRSSGIETDLNRAALQRLLDAVDADIVQAVGEHSSGSVAVTELHIGGDSAIFLDRPAASVTSVTESRGITDTVLATDDWRAWFGTRLLERLALEATNPQSVWGERVSVVYVPINDDAQRIQATIDLVRLKLQFTGLKSERAGDYGTTSMDQENERVRILRRLDRKSLIPG